MPKDIGEGGKPNRMISTKAMLYQLRCQYLDAMHQDVQLPFVSIPAPTPLSVLSLPLTFKYLANCLPEFSRWLFQPFRDHPSPALGLPLSHRRCKGERLSAVLAV